MSRADQYPADADGYIVYGPQIGEGAFARVYRAKVRTTGEDVAIKTLQVGALLTATDISLWRETKISRSSLLITTDSIAPAGPCSLSLPLRAMAVIAVSRSNTPATQAAAYSPILWPQTETG